MDNSFKHSIVIGLIILFSYVLFQGVTEGHRSHVKVRQQALEALASQRLEETRDAYESALDTYRHQ